MGSPPQRLRIAGEAFAQVLAEDGPEPGADEPVVPRPPAHPGRGVPAVELWRPDADHTRQLAGLPQAYRDVLEVIDDAGMPLRSADACRWLGIGAGHGETEAMRGKLRRPAERGWCVTPEPGRLALAPGGYGRSRETRTGHELCPQLRR